MFSPYYCDNKLHDSAAKTDNLKATCNLKSSKIIVKLIKKLQNSPNLIVIFLSSSFLKRTVCTPEIALTTVDFPWATWPIVPTLIVACLEITSGERGVNFAISCKYRK